MLGHYENRLCHTGRFPPASERYLPSCEPRRGHACGWQSSWRGLPLLPPLPPLPPLPRPPPTSPPSGGDSEALQRRRERQGAPPAARALHPCPARRRLPSPLPRGAPARSRRPYRARPSAPAGWRRGGGRPGGTASATGCEVCPWC